MSRRITITKSNWPLFEGRTDPNIKRPFRIGDTVVKCGKCGCMFISSLVENGKCPYCEKPMEYADIGLKPHHLKIRDRSSRPAAGSARTAQPTAAASGSRTARPAAAGSSRTARPAAAGSSRSARRTAAGGSRTVRRTDAAARTGVKASRWLFRLALFEFVFMLIVFFIADNKLNPGAVAFGEDRLIIQLGRALSTALDIVKHIISSIYAGISSCIKP